SFCVHRGLITYWSPYFRNAFNGSFKEAEEKEITLEDVEPSIFKTFMAWMYSQNIVLDKPIVKLPEPEPENTAYGDSDQTLTAVLYSTLVDLYIFADEYDIKQLRIDVIEMIHSANTNCKHFIPDIRAVSKALHNLPPTSGLYRYLVNVYVGDW
ncbi:uncharacterized protein BDZ99DRAFT_366573, partial [Mytilinidion resinicola]